MKKFLLISDTHGNLDEMEALVAKTGVCAVIHAGDFGFYDKESYDRLQTRELRLLITHSPFRKQYLITKETERADLIQVIQKHQLLGSFPDYLEGKKTFPVPVYAVWGNHEDHFVVETLRKNGNIQNLFILDENHLYEMDEDLLLYGIGGNWLPGKKLFQQPVGGGGGKVWSTLSQYGSLYKKVKEHEGPSLFVSHVSPGKEPLLVRLLTHFGPNLWLSGHMGPPYPCLWNPYTVRDEEEQKQWLSQELAAPEKMSEDAKLAFDLIKKPLPSIDQWYRKQWYLNLPDAGDGYAILTCKDRHLSLQTHAMGVYY